MFMLVFELNWFGILYCLFLNVVLALNSGLGRPMMVYILMMLMTFWLMPMIF